MTTAQIIIYLMLFALDVGLIIANQQKSSQPTLLYPNLFRAMIFWSVLISVTLFYNQAAERAMGKCPEYEQITDEVYRLK